VRLSDEGDLAPIPQVCAWVPDRVRLVLRFPLLGGRACPTHRPRGVRVIWRGLPIACACLGSLPQFSAKSGMFNLEVVVKTCSDHHRCQGPLITRAWDPNRGND
jgi:hypothetical protein